ncbi:MAG: transcriptional regulator, partial [Pseudonocardiales bacterium]|nr:transcriptional regulator [Pseudonocardiales bacterium]
LRGDAAVMRAQFAHLLEMSKRPRIDIQVLPFDAGGGTAPAHDGATFTVMKFPISMDNDPGLVYLEPLTGGRYVEKPEEIAVYQQALTRLRVLAADQKASRGIIQRAMKEVT